VTGKLVLAVEAEDVKILASAERQSSLEAVSRIVYELSVPEQKKEGRYLSKAVAYPAGSHHNSPTVSCRKISVATKL